MKTQMVTFKLTLDEAEELLYVAGNGWGDGDLYNLNDEFTEEDRERADMFTEARDKVSAAIQRSKRRKSQET